jgi:hypothetical protein
VFAYVCYQGAHEDAVVGTYNAALAHQYTESRHLRHANTTVRESEAYPFHHGLAFFFLFFFRLLCSLFAYAVSGCACRLKVRVS